MNYFDKCEKCFGAYTPDQQSELCLQHLMLPSVEVPTRDPGPCERYLNTNHEDCCCCQYYDRNVRSELETVEDGEIDYCCEKRNKSIHNIDFSKNCSQTLVINNNSLSFKQKLQRFENGNFDFNLSDSDDAVRIWHVFILFYWYFLIFLWNCKKTRDIYYCHSKCSTYLMNSSVIFEN